MPSQSLMSSVINWRLSCAHCRKPWLDLFITRYATGIGYNSWKTWPSVKIGRLVFIVHFARRSNCTATIRNCTTTHRRHVINRKGLSPSLSCYRYVTIHLTLFRFANSETRPPTCNTKASFILTWTNTSFVDQNPTREVPGQTRSIPQQIEMPKKRNGRLHIYRIFLGYHVSKGWPMDFYRISCATWVLSHF